MCNAVLPTPIWCNFFFANHLVSSPHKICPVVLRKQTQPETNIVFGLCAQILVAMCVQKSRSATAHKSGHTHTYAHTKTKHCCCANIAEER